MAEVGSDYIKKDGSEETEYRVEAQAQFLYSAENGNDPTECVILRPVLSGAELHEAEEAEVPTWFVCHADEFDEIFEEA